MRIDVTVFVSIYFHLVPINTTYHPRVANLHTGLQFAHDKQEAKYKGG